MVVVSDKFDGVTLLERHRMVNAVLDAELKGGVHALSIQAKTPAQWAKKAVVQDTPNCLGGSKADRK